jgi:hypothetical protein
LEIPSRGTVTVPAIMHSTVIRRNDVVSFDACLTVQQSIDTKNIVIHERDPIFTSLLPEFIGIVISSILGYMIYGAPFLENYYKLAYYLEFLMYYTLLVVILLVSSGAKLRFPVAVAFVAIFLWDKR